MDSQTTETRKCPACQGKRGNLVTSYLYPRWYDCKMCKGTGAVVVDASPVVRSGAWVGDGDALRAQIVTHMALLRNSARADFVEWVRQEHYRLARAENAESPTDGSERQRDENL